MATIKESKADLEQSLRDLLHSLLPQTAGYAVEVDILENARKKRSDASRESWRPAVGEIRIRFGGATDARSTRQSLSPSSHQDPVPDGQEPRVPQGEAGLAVQRAELINSLQTAEQRPGFHFVALKWFRDLYLPAEEYEWSTSRTLRDELIRHAIEEGIILTTKVPNPRSPAFPVTAIRLNRHHPEVMAILGEQGTTSSGFEPVDIQGEPLSATVLGERR